MRCPACQAENLGDSRFCTECGAGLDSVCATCAAHNPPAAKFCRQCGADLRAVPQANSPAPPLRPDARDPIADPLPVGPVVDGERKTVTALFADIKGSMELMEDLDPEEARAIVDPALQLMMAAVHRYEGYVAQSTGDGIFAIFGAPIAHEDHPQRALYAALRMQDEIRKHAEALRRERGVTLAIRVGLNTGEVVVRSLPTDDQRADYTPIGHSTGLAARMERLATPGSIVASAHTYKLAEGYFRFKPLGAAKVKGVSEPVPIYEVLGVGPLRTRLQQSARRGLSRFIGRHDELEQMRRQLERAQAGHGQIVAVVGEPGVGKSRLTHEFKLGAAQSGLVLETFSVSHGKAFAYLPIIELLKNYFQIAIEDDERSRREKVGGKVLMLDRSLEDTLPYLFALLGIAEPTSPLPQMDAQIRRRRTVEAIIRLLLRESVNQPLVIIVEDLHWLDSESDAFLAALGERVASARLLLLVNYRPEYQHGWGNKTYYTQLRLDPLTRADAEEMLRELLGARPQDAALRPLLQFILEKTAGTPFFMEELVQALFDQGLLARDPVRPTRPLTEIRLPPTVQGILAARIDRLPPEEKALLQTLAVLGKECSLSLIERVAVQPGDALRRRLARLQAAEFIYEQPAFPEPDYTFKHALTQEVGYGSLLVERRRVLHERAAQAIEALCSERLAEHFGELARHYRHTDNHAKAVHYLQLAAQQAVERSAHAEASAHLHAALERIPSLPDTPARAEQELLLQISLGSVLAVTTGWGAPERERTFARAHELCGRVGDSPRLFPVLFGVATVRTQQGRHRAAAEVAEQTLRLAQRLDLPEGLLLAHAMAAESAYWLGDLAAVRRHLDAGLPLYDDHRHRSLAFVYGVDLAIYARGYLIYGGCMSGHADQALQEAEELLALARRLAHPYSFGQALLFAGFVHQLRRDATAVDAIVEAETALAADHGFREWLAWATYLRGWALAEHGQTDEGVRCMREVLDAFCRDGSELGATWILATLAEAHLRAGQTAEGLTAVADAIAIARKNDERVSEAEIHRLKGELLLAGSGQGEAPREQASLEAEQCFHEACAAARRHTAKFMELRAATSLARLWHRCGKTDQARELLAAIYGWFTEGFETADLREARALLEQLS